MVECFTNRLVLIHMLLNDVIFGFSQICIVSVYHPVVLEPYDISNNL